MNRVRFVADVHLTAEDPSRGERFLSFLRESPPDLSRLLVLGDLFDYWVGAAQLSEHSGIIDALAALSAKGVRVEFVAGNHDFLVGPELAARTGMAIYGDEVEVEVGGTRVLATHGDLLCTRDTHYQAYRRFARSALVRWAFTSLPGGMRRRVARRWERKSAEIVARKSAETRRIDDDAVKRALARGFDAVVCGHAHREERRELTGGLLFVLGSWEEGASWLEWNGGVFEFAGASE